MIYYSPNIDEFDGLRELLSDYGEECLDFIERKTGYTFLAGFVYNNGYNSTYHNNIDIDYDFFFTDGDNIHNYMKEVAYDTTECKLTNCKIKILDNFIQIRPETLKGYLSEERTFEAGEITLEDFTRGNYSTPTIMNWFYKEGIRTPNELNAMLNLYLL